MSPESWHAVPLKWKVLIVILLLPVSLAAIWLGYRAGVVGGHWLGGLLGYVVGFIEGLLS